MLFQFVNESYTWNMESILTPLIEFLVILFVVLFMIYIYVKLRIVPLVFLTFIIAIIICMVSITRYDIPLTPFIQLFAILICTVLFLQTVFEYNKKRK